MHECSPALPFIASVTLVKLTRLSKPQYALLKMGMRLPTQRHHKNLTRDVLSLLLELGTGQTFHDGKYCQGFPKVFMGTNLTHAAPSLQLVPIK